LLNERPRNLPYTRKEQRRRWSRDTYLKRYPRLCAHIICTSLGYASPAVAANILRDADQGRSNYCEWIAAVYKDDPTGAVSDAIRHRRHHRDNTLEY
jgi:hypothetical protein